MPSPYTLDFEKPLLELERQIDDLKRIGSERQIDIDGELEGLQAKLDSASASIAAGNFGAAVNQLEALLHELDAMERSGRLSPADATHLRTEVQRVIDSIEN